MKATQFKKVNHFKNKASRLNWLISSLFLLSAPQLQAAEIEKEFFLGSEVLHLSNPNFAVSDKKPVTVFKIEPAVNLTMTTELNKLYLKSLLAVYRNSNEDVLPNRENPTLILGWERALPSGLFGLEAEYNETVALNEQLDRLGQGTGINVDNQTRTKKLLAKWDHDFNSKFSLKNEAVYNDITYSESSLFLVDYRLLGAQSRLIYHNTEAFSTYGQLGHFQYTPDNSDSKTNLSRFRLGVVTAPLEGLEVDANAGLYKTTGSNSDTGVEGEVIGKYVRDRISYNFGISRLLIPGGVNNFQKTNTLVLGTKYLLSDLQTVGAEYNNTLSKIGSQTQTVLLTTGSIRTQSIGLFYEHTFKNWLARASAKFIELENGGSSRYGNEIGVSLVYGPLSF